MLLGLLALLVFGVWYRPPAPARRTQVPGGDIVLFRAVVERVRAGERYYPTMRSELRARGYPTASVFNWRPPATFLLLATAPRLVQGVLLGLGVVAVLLTFWAFRQSPVAITVAATVLAIGSAALPFVPADGLYLPELWAGLFLLVSILAYTLGAVRLGAFCAVAAVCARELAFPYAAAGLGLALHAGRRTEVRWYVVGLCVFATYYAVHALTAYSHIQPGDMAHTFSWITFGGWPFVVTTVGMGGWLILLPRWAAAIGAVVVLASLWGPADRHLKAMVVIYLVGFSIVGQSFNNSWGLLTGPAWGLAMVHGLLGLRQLLGASSPEPIRRRAHNL